MYYITRKVDLLFLGHLRWTLLWIFFCKEQLFNYTTEEQRNPWKGRKVWLLFVMCVVQCHFKNELHLLKWMSLIWISYVFWPNLYLLMSFQLRKPCDHQHPCCVLEIANQKSVASAYFMFSLLKPMSEGRPYCKISLVPEQHCFSCCFYIIHYTLECNFQYFQFLRLSSLHCSPKHSYSLLNLLASILLQLCNSAWDCTVNVRSGDFFFKKKIVQGPLLTRQKSPLYALRLLV